MECKQEETNSTYENFIKDIINIRGRHGCGEEYHEKHHIVPKCLGGTNDEENLIDLYAREHFEAHRLLALENPHVKGLQYAWWCISVMQNKYEEGRYVCTPEEYEEVKKSFIRPIVARTIQCMADITVRSQGRKSKRIMPTLREKIIHNMANQSRSKLDER